MYYNFILHCTISFVHGKIVLFWVFTSRNAFCPACPSYRKSRPEINSGRLSVKYSLLHAALSVHTSFDLLFHIEKRSSVYAVIVGNDFSSAENKCADHLLFLCVDERLVTFWNDNQLMFVKKLFFPGSYAHQLRAHALTPVSHLLAVISYHG